MNERKGIIEILLRYGADRSIPNNAGLLPIELAPNKMVKELFLRDRSSIFSPIVQSRALLTDYIEQLNNSPLPPLLSSSSSSLHAVDSNKTPIHNSSSSNPDVSRDDLSSLNGYNLSADLIENEPVASATTLAIDPTTTTLTVAPLPNPTITPSSSIIADTSTTTTEVQDQTNLHLDISQPLNAMNPTNTNHFPETRPFTPPKTQFSSIEGDYTVVGITSIKKPPLSTTATTATSTRIINDVSSNHHPLHHPHDIDSNSNSPVINSRPPHSGRAIEVPILNFDKLPPPPTSFTHTNTTTTVAGSTLSSSDSGNRSGRINFYHPQAMPSPRATIPLNGQSSIDAITIAPSSSSSLLSGSVGPSLSMTNMMIGSNGIASKATLIENYLEPTPSNSNNNSIVIDNDESELQFEVMHAAIETAKAMHGKTDARDLCHQMIRNCQKLNEPKFRQLLACDPTLSTTRATKLLNLAVDGQTPLHLAAGFGNLRALQIMVEMGQKHNVSLWIRDMQGRTPLHIAAEKGNDVDTIRGMMFGD